MRFEFIDAEKAHYPVLVLCAVLLVSRSGYYGWAKRSESARAKSDAQLSAQIRAVHHKSCGRYGSPRIHAELRARGMRVGKKRVERLMRAQRLAARRKRRFRRTTDSRHNGPSAPNVIERQFDARAPNQVWVTDVTYIPTGEGWLYLAVILDLFSRRVVGWAASAFNDRALEDQSAWRGGTTDARFAHLPIAIRGRVFFQEAGRAPRLSTFPTSASARADARSAPDKRRPYPPVTSAALALGRPTVGSRYSTERSQSQSGCSANGGGPYETTAGK
ncbi:IS3 family transposase [Sorangium sp. So ce321]